MTHLEHDDREHLAIHHSSEIDPLRQKLMARESHLKNAFAYPAQRNMNLNKALSGAMLRQT
jgi:hypothetical protein